LLPGDEEPEIETLPANDDHDFPPTRDSTEFELDLQSQGEIPFSDNEEASQQRRLARYDDEEEEDEDAESYPGDSRRATVIHPDDYLPAHHLTMSENETTDSSESAALFRRRRSPGHSASGNPNRMGFVAARDSFAALGSNQGSGSDNEDVTSDNRPGVCSIEDSDEDGGQPNENARLLASPSGRSASPQLQITKL
jgi:hypothetical protein